MNRKSTFLVGLLLFLAISLVNTLQAQVFPTSATVRLVPPYNTFLSELSQGNSDKVQVILLQRDQSVPNYDVRLKFKVKLAGNVIFETAPNFVSPIINLEQNNPIVLSGADLATYFQANNLVFANANLRNIYVNNGQIPEGLYDFCATVYSATRADRQLSNNACQIFSLSRSLPPLLNLPACGGAIPEQNPLNLRFWWTPQHSNSVNSAANTSYVLEIFEILNADGNANNAVLSSNPVFSFPTPLTQYFYTISDPNFIVGRRYAWRVRVIDDSNRDAFINNGYSAVCEFTYAPTLSNGQTLVPILAPANIQAEGKGIRAGRVYWSAFVGTALDRPDRYKVEYKKVGVGLEWFSEFTTTNELLINQGLEPATTYEARVQGEKGGFLGESSSIVTFTTFIPVTPVCGVTPTNALENMTPMRNARIGMPIEVTGFEVVLDSLEAESTPGVYSGRGLIKIPFMLNQTFTVLFESLFINELGQAGEGKVWFKTKPIEEWIADQAGQTAANQQEAQDILNNQQTFADTPFYDDVITFGNVGIQGITVNAQGQVILTTTTGGTFLADTTLVPKRPRDRALIIEDKDGNQWVIQPNGSVVAAPHGGLPPKYNYSDDKLDATDSLRVDFTQKLTPSPQLFGFDARRKGNTYFKWAKNFEAIRLKSGLPYFVPYQSLGGATLTATNTQREEVVVNIKYLPKATEPAFNESSLTFKLGTTVITAKTATTTTAGYTASFLFNLPAVPITGTSGDEPFLYAYYGTKKIGKINIAPLKRREEKVILVPVNSAVVPNEVVLQTYLDSVYRQANVKFTVIPKGNFVFGLGADASLERGGDGINKYSSEMRALRDAYITADATYDKTASYIFVIPSFTGGGLDGFMVRGRSMGFVASGANKRTYAHELGHGAFGLEHTFPEIGQSLSNNLMDYGDSTHLTHKQCKDIAKRKFVFNWLDSEEDGANMWIYGGNHYFDYNGNFLFNDSGIDNEIRIVLPFDNNPNYYPYRYPPYSYRPSGLVWQPLSGLSFIEDKFFKKDEETTTVQILGAYTTAYRITNLNKIIATYSNEIDKSLICYAQKIDVSSNGFYDETTDKICVSLDFSYLISSEMSNYQNMISMIVHEKRHKDSHKGKGSLELSRQGAVLHLEAYDTQIRHESWKKISNKYKAVKIASVGYYLFKINNSENSSDTYPTWNNIAQERKLYFENLLGIVFEPILSYKTCELQHIKWKNKNGTQIFDIKYFKKP